MDMAGAEGGAEELLRTEASTSLPQPFVDGGARTNGGTTSASVAVASAVIPLLPPRQNALASTLQASVCAPAAAPSSSASTQLLPTSPAAAPLSAEVVPFAPRAVAPQAVEAEAAASATVSTQLLPLSPPSATSSSAQTASTSMAAAMALMVVAERPAATEAAPTPSAMAPSPGAMPVPFPSSPSSAVGSDSKTFGRVTPVPLELTRPSSDRRTVATPTLGSPDFASTTLASAASEVWEGSPHSSAADEDRQTLAGHAVRQDGTSSRRSMFGLPTSASSPNGEYNALPTVDFDEPVREGSEPDHDQDGGLEALAALDNCHERWRGYVKVLLEDPSSSTAASVTQYASIALITFSVSVAIIETEPSQRDNVIFQVCEPIFTVLFTFEISLRLWTCDSCRLFFTSIFNIIDILATLPCYTDLLLPVLKDSSSSERGMQRHVSESLQALRLAGLVRVARLFRLLRILRVANTMRQSEMIIVVIRAVYGSLSGIWVLMTFMFVGLILSATCTYCCEMSDPTSDFVSIPISIWWAATTITAVGYGDTLPKTVAGKILAVLTMFLGLIIMAVCIAVVSNSFTIQFQRELYASRIRGMQKKLTAKQPVDMNARRREGAALRIEQRRESGGVWFSDEPAVVQPNVGRADSRSRLRFFSESNVVAALVNHRAQAAGMSSPRFGQEVVEKDFASMVSQLEDMAEALLLGMEALIDAEATWKGQGMAGAEQRGGSPARTPLSEQGRCARMTLEMLRGSNRLWFEQARSLSEELLRLSEDDIATAHGRS
mmetsp:Transcript_88735/g.284896  ORF Transcript_88735/g.284896 Transcript_88735/m.284896 type:complete len:777 (+) Transcript_88735:60-2390(+)